jgi:hypothetical protein
MGVNGTQQAATEKLTSMPNGVKMDKIGEIACSPIQGAAILPGGRWGPSF